MLVPAASGSKFQVGGSLFLLESRHWVMPPFRAGTTVDENWRERGYASQVAGERGRLSFGASSPCRNVTRDADYWNNEVEPLPRGREPVKDSQSFL